MRLPFALAFVLALMLLVASKVQASPERVDLQDRVAVDVFSLDKTGAWHVRKVQVHEFSDARIVACVEQPNDEIADCLVVIDDEVVAMLKVKLLEHKA